MFSRSLITMTLFSLVNISQAAPFSGKFFRDDRWAPKIQFFDGSELGLKSENKAVQRDLLRLQPGDLLAGQGTKQPLDLLLRSIELVGLSNLVGLWGTNGPDHRYFEFLDFRKLSIYRDDFFGKNLQTLSGSSTYWFEYVITPSYSNTWTIYISNTSGEFSGNLVLHNGQLRISIINAKTGNVVHRVKLHRLSN